MPRPADAPEINVIRLRELLEHLTAHPEEHDQNLWAMRKREPNGDCKTACCAAGWTVSLSNEYSIAWRSDALRKNVEFSEYAINERGFEQHVKTVARELLGFTTREASVFFASDNSLYQLWNYASTWTDGAIERPAEVVHRWSTPMT